MTDDRRKRIGEIAGHDLAVYFAGWCPDCRRLEQALDRARIPHRAVDIEADPAAAERLERETGMRAIPYILVDGVSWVRGYHKELPERFNLDLLLAELTAALPKKRTGPMKEKGS